MLFHTDAHNHPGGIKRLKILGPGTGDSVSVSFFKLCENGKARITRSAKKAYRGKAGCSH